MGELRDYMAATKNAAELIEHASKCEPFSGGSVLVGPIILEDIVPEIRELDPEQCPALFAFLAKLEALPKAGERWPR